MNPRKFVEVFDTWRDVFATDDLEDVSSPDWFYDGVHFSEAAHTKFLDGIWRVLRGENLHVVPAVENLMVLPSEADSDGKVHQARTVYAHRDAESAVKLAEPLARDQASIADILLQAGQQV